MMVAPRILKEPTAYQSLVCLCYVDKMHSAKEVGVEAEGGSEQCFNAKLHA